MTRARHEESICGAEIGSAAWFIRNGIPVDLGEKLNFGVVTQAAVNTIERMAARFNMRLDLMRRLGNPE